MVAPLKTRRIVCTVLAADDDVSLLGGRIDSRPSQLVPWADPYIAGLVRRLQSEIRFERATVAVENRNEPMGTAVMPLGKRFQWPGAAEQADLEPPSPAYDPDWEWQEEPRWTMDEEPLDDSTI